MQKIRQFYRKKSDKIKCYENIVLLNFRENFENMFFQETPFLNTQMKCEIAQGSAFFPYRDPQQIRENLSKFS